jgi:O-antigen/teichoic acid export membrane protein
VPSQYVGDARLALVLAGLWQCTVFVSITFTACLLGTGRMYLVNLKGFAVSALVTAAQAVTVLLGGRLTELAAVLLVGAVVTIVVFRRDVRRAYPDVEIKFRLADRPMAKRLLSLGWRNSISSLSSTLAFGSDVVLVGLLLNPTAAAAYALALRGHALLNRLATGVMGPLGPSHAHAAKHASAERRFRLFLLGVSTSLVLALSIGLSVAVFAEPLLDLWLGAVPPDTAVILVVLCAVLILQMPGLNAYSVLLNSEQASELMRITLAAAAVNILASIAFTLWVGALGSRLTSSSYLFGSAG